MADEPELTQADFDAADEVLKRNPVDGRIHEESRETLAQLHAHLGRSKFRLYYELRKPRGKYEEWRLQSWQRKITLEEMKELMRARAERPVDQEMIEESYAQLEARLEQYSMALQAIAKAANPRHSSQRRASFERVAIKHFARTRRKFTLDRQELFTLHEYLDHARLEAGLGLAVAGEHSATNAMLLICLVVRQADESWHSSLETARRSRTDTRYLYETSAAELWQKVSASSYPRPQHLLTLLEQEQTAAKVMLRKRDAAASVATTIVVPSATIEVQNGEFTGMVPAQASPGKKEKPSGPPTPLLKVKQWSDIVVGYDPKDGFWVLEQPLAHGDPFSKSKAKRFIVVDGQLKSLLVALANSQTGNAVPMSDVMRIFELLPPPSQVQRDTRAEPGAIEHELRLELVDTLRGARSKLSSAIADVGRKFRMFVDGPKGKKDPCFSVRQLDARKLDVRSGFVVRCLCATSDRKYTFGPARLQDG